MTLRYEDVATWLKRIYTNYDFDLTSILSRPWPTR